MSPENKVYDDKMLKTIEVVKSNFASVRRAAPMPACWIGSW